MTSGASDEPPMPHSTTRSTPSPAQLLAQGRDLAEQRPGGAGQVDPGQPDRRLGLGVRAPERGVLGEQLARRTAPRRGRRRLVAMASAAAPDATTPSALTCRPAVGDVGAGEVEVGLRLVEQLAPGGLELLDALALEQRGHVGVGDAEALEGVEHAAGLVVGAGDRVAGDLAVVGDGVEGLLRHGVDGVRGDQLGDVEGVGVGRVLDAGGGPQRTLGVAPRRRRGSSSAGSRRPPRRPGRRAGRWPRAALPLRALASSVPMASSRLSISVSTRETKNEATEWILERSLPSSRACSRPVRKAFITPR